MGGNYETIVMEVLEKLSHLSDKSLANSMGVSTAMVSRWRNGKATPNETNLENIRRLGHGMKLIKISKFPTNEEIKEMITRCGGITKTSKIVGKSTALIYQWRWGDCKPSPIDCKRMKINIERSE